MKKWDTQNVVRKFKGQIYTLSNYQIPGIDFHNTQALTIQTMTLQLLIALATQYNLKICVLDYKNVYLNSILCELVYIHPPCGYKNKDKPNIVWCLKRALYGLRQATREWYLTL